MSSPTYRWASMPRARRCTSCRSRAAPRAEAISVATRPPRARRVARPPPTPPPTAVFPVLSDQIARDYALSPDATRVAFLVPGLVQGQFVSRTYVAEIKSKGVSALPSPAGLAPRDQISPAWHPDGKSVAIGQLPRAGEPGRVAG